MSFADVEGANIVGYQNLQTTGDRYNMITVPFANIGGVGTQEGNFDFNTNIKGQFVGVDNPDDEINADRIQVWDPTKGTSGAYPVESQLYYLDYGMPEINGWYNGYQKAGAGQGVLDDGLPAGAGFWLIKKDGANNAISMSGQVPAAASVTKYAYKGRYNMLADPYPIRLMVNDETQVEWKNRIGVDNPDDEINADRIQIWDPTKGTSGAYPVESQLYYLDYGMPEINGWYNGYQKAGAGQGVFDNGFEVGQTFWYIAAGTYSTTDKVEIIFKNPTKTVPAE